jgi:hypothetical protein
MSKTEIVEYTLQKKNIQAEVSICFMSEAIELIYATSGFED